MRIFAIGKLRDQGEGPPRTRRAVLDRRLVCRRLAAVGLVEPMLQDRFDRAVTGGAEIVAGFEPCRAVAPGQPQNAEAGAEALLGMRLGLRDGFDEGDGGGADRSDRKTIMASGNLL
jgi:hypothetical protein